MSERHPLQSVMGWLDGGQAASIESGPALYVVGSPIGNLRDVTLRALDVLASVDLILCEDTRTSAILLKRYGIQTRRRAYRAQSRRADDRFALERLRAGDRLALLSEAGMPGISDPGSSLVREVREQLSEVPVFAIPGPSAFVSALSISGWQTNPAMFLGFLSNKAGRRERALERVRDFEGPIVLYESVHRVAATIEAIRRVLPGRDILIGRELTKMHEETLILAAGLTEAEFEAALAKLTRKGEFTLVLGPRNE
ncbi:MAG: 16S rRNA (cytidine(1402)-2'-O)-methyltransferase [Spirochaetales bacterium]|nr:16S rRNA (cytidine(1402)-2'-O)-methyltransferase [Leptospiraceae bacterium]MCP5481176.1 16S rRNA (cytidine(1402)-2'-O)-methyltransferase [Spirochaetales bacterium]